jgi:hypothetical protein
MVHNKKKATRFLLILSMILISTLHVLGQSLSIRPVSSTPKSTGYYEFLPKGYDGNKRFPVIIFNHGYGELGTGQPGDIESLLRNGLIKYIKADGLFRDTFKCIIIAPQYRSWPYGADMKALIDFVVTNYAVDAGRIYITGLSMGGAATWSAASYDETLTGRIAAMVPICGAANPDSYGMTTIANTGVAVWATHNADDGTVSVNQTHGWVDGINSRSPKIIAKKTIWPTGNHNAWDRTHDPKSKEFNGGNIYDWMLQFSRNVPITPLPPAFTGLRLTTGNAFATWKTDIPYLTYQSNGWGNNTMGIVLNIKNTTEQQLYNVERFGTFSYAIPLIPGIYNLRLHFAELFWSNPGQRVFNVDAEGIRILNNFDIIVAAGGKYTAVQRNVLVNVQDGTLNLSFISAVDKAKLTAIEILPENTFPQPLPGYTKISVIEYRDSATNALLKQYTDTLTVPFKVIVK